MASSTYTGDYSRTGKPVTSKAETVMEKAAETAGRVVGTAEEVAKAAGDKAMAVAGKVSETTGKVVGALEEASPRLREAQESVGEVANNFYGATRKSVAKQPMATLAVAAGIGFVLGALWKS